MLAKHSSRTFHQSLTCCHQSAKLCHQSLILSDKSATFYQQTLTLFHQAPNFDTKRRNVGTKRRNIGTKRRNVGTKRRLINAKGSCFTGQSKGDRSEWQCHSASALPLSQRTQKGLTPPGTPVFFSHEVLSFNVSRAIRSHGNSETGQRDISSPPFFGIGTLRAGQ